MTRTDRAAPLAVVARGVSAELAGLAPQLVDGFHAAIPAATAEVTHRLVTAAYREQLVAHRWSSSPVSRPRGAPDAMEIAVVRPDTERTHQGEPGRVLANLLGEGCTRGAAAELTDTIINLALAYARRAGQDAAIRERANHAGVAAELDLIAGLDADDQVVFLERLATEGHNLHPFGRMRLGWSTADLLAYDLESPVAAVHFVGVRRDLHIGDDVGARLRSTQPGVAYAIDANRYAVTPVHEWQLGVVGQRYAELIRTGALVPLGDPVLAAEPTAALRTLLLPPGHDGIRRYLKLSLDIQVTSTRRTISVASTRNGPAISAYLSRFADTEAGGARVVIMAETEGSAVALPVGGERDLSAIVRHGLSGRLGPAEVAIPAVALTARSALTGRSVIADLVDRFTTTRGHPSSQIGAREFLREYTRLILEPTLTLMTRHGIGFEAHLQNCVPTFVDAVPHRLCLRDFAGIRIYPARLRNGLTLWPGSVTVTADLDLMRAKVAYTVVYAHLGELITRLAGSHGLAEQLAWAVVRDVLDESYAELRRDGSAAAAADDYAFLTGPTLPHKALLRMRLTPDAGDIYVPVWNPLRGPT